MNGPAELYLVLRDKLASRAYGPAIQNGLSISVNGPRGHYEAYTNLVSLYFDKNGTIYTWTPQGTYVNDVQTTYFSFIASILNF